MRVIILIAILTFFSCEDDDKISVNEIEKEPTNITINDLNQISGVWEYKNISSSVEIDLNEDSVKNSDLTKEIDPCYLDNEIKLTKEEYRFVDIGILCPTNVEREVIQGGKLSLNSSTEVINLSYDFGANIFGMRGAEWLDVKLLSSNTLSYSIINEEGFPGSKLVKIEMTKISEN